MLVRFNGVTFGGRTGPLIITKFSPPTNELENDYRDKIADDGSYVSRDYLRSASWVFDIATNTKSLDEALEAAGSLQRAWRDTKVREALDPHYLSYSHDGNMWYRIYGKPGKFTSLTPDVHANLGVGLLTAEFIQTDPTVYAETPNIHTITAVPSSTGGLVAPLVSPLMTQGESQERAGRLVNEGDNPSPVRIRFYGPSTDPTVYNSEGYSLTYYGTLSYDMHVTIDPISHDVVLRGGAQVPGRLSRRTRLSDLKTPPGTTDWYYKAVDPTGTSKVEISTRSAYSTFK